jgi:hypothetical protein
MGRPRHRWENIEIHLKRGTLGEGGKLATLARRGVSCYKLPGFGGMIGGQGPEYVTYVFYF